MDKFGVQLALEHVKEARAAWAKANREYQAGEERVMRVLVHEATRNFMSPGQIVAMSGLTKQRVRKMLNDAGLRAHDGKRVLSELAAKALAENADLLGVSPNEIDLLSPLAYLPMGDTLRRELSQVSKVTQFPETHGSAHQMAEKLTNAGVLFEDAVEWVNAVIAAGEQIK